jgi:beta-N-acetylhexosaminidase
MTPLGPVMVAVDGLELGPGDRARLLHPLVGGVILFAANYRDRRQVTQLCASIRALRTPELLIAVDHEGGRVQRFREGYTAIPPMRVFGRLHDSDPAAARAAARAAGIVIATELRSCGVDLSLTPVLDVDHGASTIIGNRAFHTDPHVIALVAGSLLDGLEAGGMTSVGKHYPGHGYIRADSHLELPVDERPLAAIEACDLIPFARLAHRLGGIMPAHVLYPQVDSRPAGFSRRWLQEILRIRLGYDGVIFSDDLGMEGAAGEGSLAQRAHAAMDAGCDMVLACTAGGADALLQSVDIPLSPQGSRRLEALRSRPAAPTDVPWDEAPAYRQAVLTLAAVQGETPA